MNELIPVQSIPYSKAAGILTFPTSDSQEGKRRVSELHILGVKDLELRGPHTVSGVPVLGKGHVGIVVAARVQNRTVALKIRRIDADRSSLLKEAENLKIANKTSVGPQLIMASHNFLLMELVEGDYLPNWVKKLDQSKRSLLQSVVYNLLEKTRRLDHIGLDHGELSNAHRHVIVSRNEPRIIDFESASTERRVANVTSITQYLYFNQKMKTRIQKIIVIPDQKKLIETLKKYKTNPNSQNYDKIIEILAL